MACCYSVVQIFNQFLKNTFCVYRPWIRDSRIEPVSGAKSGATGYSFPSGHTASSTGVYGSLGIFCRKNYKLISIFSFILIFLIMFSRNWLGVHTPQDVIVAFLCGFVLIVLS